MTYQEDVMRIARELAGYTMGEADLLRRAMGKKIAAEMATHRETFHQGRGRDAAFRRAIAEQIFEQAAKFAGYGFNKGHAAAYAQVAYQTAYLKANYPVEFLAASMTLDIGIDRPAQYLPPGSAAAGHQGRCRRTSTAPKPCSPAMPKRASIFYALAAVKGVGRQAMDHVVAMREADGPFASLADFARRVDPQARQQARLRKSGARRRLRQRSARTAASWWKSSDAS